ncbi:MAG TPA: hypothetical protein PKX00_15875 [Opitutaceae bacterium]|nr:hypothetical protein [Opitutaceae bacterium]
MQALPRMELSSPTAAPAPATASAGKSGPSVDRAGDEEGESVAAVRTGKHGSETTPFVSAFDDDGPPLDVLAADEASMGSLSADVPRVAVEAAPRREAAGEAENLPTPPLDGLIERIPAPVRELMDELFRARYVKVTRIPAAVLKAR